MRPMRVLMEQPDLSKTRRKQAMTALQKLGVEMVGLKKSQIDQLHLPEQLLDAVLEVATKKEMLSIHLNAQTSAIGFYEKAGFYKIGAEFLDAGIPHYQMIYRR